MEIADGPTNMALDAALLQTGGWRVYAWDGPWVSLGRFQDPARAVTPGWDRWCVRPTGGRAVLHGHDVTFAFAEPLEGDARNLRAVYRRLIRPLVEALNACGLEARLAEETRFVGGHNGEDCFAACSPNDVVCPVSGHKLCGCALRVAGGMALLQASVPVRSPEVDGLIVGGVSHPVRSWNDEGFEAAIRRALRSR